MNATEEVTTDVDIIERCPVCNDTVAVRLDPRWQLLVTQGHSIPIVGCGSPWHYVNRNLRLGEVTPALIQSSVRDIIDTALAGGDLMAAIERARARGVPVEFIR